MITKVLEYSNRYEVTVTEDDMIWFSGTWGKDSVMSVEQIKNEAELLANQNKFTATEQPVEVTTENEG